MAEKTYLKEEIKKREIENLAYTEEKRKMTIKDAKNEWIALQSNNNHSVLNRRNSMLSNNPISSERINSESIIEYIDLNAIKSSKDLNKFVHNANNSNQTLDSGFTSIGNTSDYDVYNSNRLLNTKFKSLTKPTTAAGPRIIGSPSNSSLDNEDLHAYGNSKSNSRSNSAISTYSKSIKNNIAINGSVNNLTYYNNNNINSSSNNNNNQQNVNNGTSNAIYNNINSKKSIALNNGSNIIEDNCVLFFYGIRALEIVDLRLDSSIINQITTLSFHFIDYDDYLAKNIFKIRNKFTNVTVSHLF